MPLSDSVLALPDPQRSLLAAQIVYTLRQVGGVKGVMIKVNSSRTECPEATRPVSRSPLMPFLATWTLFRSWPGISCTRSAAVSIW